MSKNKTLNDVIGQGTKFIVFFCKNLYLTFYFKIQT